MARFVSQCPDYENLYWLAAPDNRDLAALLDDEHYRDLLASMRPFFEVIDRIGRIDRQQEGGAAGQVDLQ